MYQHLLHCRLNHHQLLELLKPKHSRESTTTHSTTLQNNQQATIPAPDEDEMSAFFQQLNSAHPTSAILSLVEPRQHLRTIHLKELDIYHGLSRLSSVKRIKR